MRLIVEVAFSESLYHQRGIDIKTTTLYKDFAPTAFVSDGAAWTVLWADKTCEAL
jgi:hypothetical protein